MGNAEDCAVDKKVRKRSSADSDLTLQLKFNKIPIILGQEP